MATCAATGELMLRARRTDRQPAGYGEGCGAGVIGNRLMRLSDIPGTPRRRGGNAHRINLPEENRQLTDNGSAVTLPTPGMHGETPPWCSAIRQRSRVNISGGWCADWRR